MMSSGYCSDLSKTEQLTLFVAAIEHSIKTHGIEGTIEKLDTSDTFSEAVPSTPPTAYYLGIAEWDFKSNKYKVVYSIPKNYRGIEVDLATYRKEMYVDEHLSTFRYIRLHPNDNLRIRELMFEDLGNEILFIQYEKYLTIGNKNYTLWFNTDK
jgi:hypothetical protein